MNSRSAKLYLLPSPLSDADPTTSIPEGTRSAVSSIRHFICETPKSARRYLKRLGIDNELGDLNFYPLNVRTDPADIPAYLDPCRQGSHTALLSDAGSPGVADPGARIIAMAHREGIPVVPLVGPSSFLLALMASGLNGQRFSFHGYAPYEKKDLKRLIEKMSARAKEGESQLLMETPYRNERLLDAFLQHAYSDLKLCIARDLTGKDEFVRTLSVQDWKKERPALHKVPAVFILGSDPS